MRNEESPRTAWAGPVLISWFPDRGLIQFTAWRSCRVTNQFTLRAQHLVSAPEAIAVLRAALDAIASESETATPPPSE